MSPFGRCRCPSRRSRASARTSPRGGKSDDSGRLGGQSGLEFLSGGFRPKATDLDPGVGGAVRHTVPVRNHPATYSPSRTMARPARMHQPLRRLRERSFRRLEPSCPAAISTLSGMKPLLHQSITRAALSGPRTSSLPMDAVGPRRRADPLAQTRHPPYAVHPRQAVPEGA